MNDNIGWDSDKDTEDLKEDGWNKYKNRKQIYKFDVIYSGDTAIYACYGNLDRDDILEVWVQYRLNRNISMEAQDHLSDDCEDSSSGIRESNWKEHVISHVHQKQSTYPGKQKESNQAL